MYLLSWALSPCCFRERVHRLTVYTLFEGTSPRSVGRGTKQGASCHIAVVVQVAPEITAGEVHKSDGDSASSDRPGRRVDTRHRHAVVVGCPDQPRCVDGHPGRLGADCNVANESAVAEKVTYRVSASEDGMSNPHVAVPVYYAALRVVEPMIVSRDMCPIGSISVD